MRRLLPLYVTAIFAGPGLDGVAPVFRHFGRWTVTKTNDPWMNRLPQPIVVEVHPEGKFTAGPRIWGTFAMDSTDKGFAVDMVMWDLSILTRRYTLVPLDPRRILLFPIHREARFYLLEKTNDALVRRPV